MTEGNLDIFLCPLNAYGGCFWEYLENDKYEKKCMTVPNMLEQYKTKQSNIDYA